MFVHLLRNPDARYAIGAVVSWPIYGALYMSMLDVFDRHYAPAAGVSWKGALEFAERLLRLLPDDPRLARLIDELRNQIPKSQAQ